MNDSIQSVIKAQIVNNRNPITTNPQVYTDATQDKKGIVQLATNDEVNQGSNTTKVVTPFSLSANYVKKTTTINGKTLDSNINLNYEDVNALPANTVIPTVNNATLTIKKNGTTINTFTANSNTNVTCDIEVPILENYGIIVIDI